MRHAAALVLVVLFGSCGGGQRLAPTAGAATAYRHVPIGLCEDYPEESTPFPRVREDMEALRALGVRTLRVSLPWDSIEPHDDRFDWSFWDRFVDLASGEYGLRLIPYVAYTPAWAVREGASEPWHEPPLDVAEFEEFVGVLAARYGDRIDSWELWNEPDNPGYWSGTTAAYAELVRAGSRAVRRSDPTALVVLGGIAWNTDFVRELFEEHGIAPHVDVVNVHSYVETWSADALETVPAYVARIARIVDEHGQGEAVWAAEVGYSSFRRGRRVSADYTARYDYEHTAAFQAVALVRLLVLLRSTDELDLVAWYEIRDLVGGTDVIGDENNRHLGILRPDGRPKPSWTALRFVRRLLDAPLRVAAGEVSATDASAGAVPFELHAFERADGTLVVFAWIPTRAAGEAPGSGDARRASSPSPSRGADRRAADLTLRVATNAAEAVVYDELGRRRSRVALLREGPAGVMPLHLRAGDVAVVVVDGHAVP